MIGNLLTGDLNTNGWVVLLDITEKNKRNMRANTCSIEKYNQGRLFFLVKSNFWGFFAWQVPNGCSPQCWPVRYQVLTSVKVKIVKTTNLPNFICLFLSYMTIKNEWNGGWFLSNKTWAPDLCSVILLLRALVRISLLSGKHVNARKKRKHKQ